MFQLARGQTKPNQVQLLAARVSPSNYSSCQFTMLPWGSFEIAGPIWGLIWFGAFSICTKGVRTLMAVAVCTRESCNEFPIWNGNEHDYAAPINGGGGEDRRWRQLYAVDVGLCPSMWLWYSLQPRVLLQCNSDP
ncbi:hypothetical protein pipiens_014352 [Culex pipiens pipiens]|uniref:Uncharacterized protein n=1 Tax=Culex pipiens pipiens TaxID=38569 RepID=A0ABD1CV38_CULPP